MEVVDIHEASNRLFQLVEQLTKGESFIIARDGKPVARVSGIGIPQAYSARRLGFLKGQLSVPDDFDRMGESITTP